MSSLPFTSDRDSVIRQLHVAAVDGRLSLDEAERRIAIAREASSDAELALLLPDAYDAPVEPGMAPNRPLEINAGWGTAKRTGDWTLPPFVRVSSGVGSVKLDLTRARSLSPGSRASSISSSPAWA